ncbi:MAG: AAA family ATPase [Candidatus Aenigmarchaeota archaeon]|nr:AAA family ATPase [Candidatus Aenigmarchaeota archaeon]
MVLRRVVAVVSGKGGVGKTTVTANLGVALFSEFERSVLLIDSNLTSSHLGIHFGLIYFPFTINSILEGETRLMNAIYRHPSGVHLLPASFNVYEEPEITYRKFSYIIRKVKNLYDFILIDTAPGLGKFTKFPLRVADEVLIVMNPDVPSMLEAKKIIKICSKLKKKIVGVVLNKVSFSKYELSPNEIREELKKEIIGIIPEDDLFKKSLSIREPVVFSNPFSFPSLQFKIMAANILGIKNYKPEIPIKEKIKLSFLKLFGNRIYLLENSQF